LHRILRAVEESSCPNLRSTHLVLHGASGLPSSLIHRAIAEGQICKLNVNTDLREAALSSMRKAFADGVSRGSSGGKRVDVLALMKGSYGAMKAVAREKISLFRGEPGEGSGD
jgi:fructose/tagatose bisphosphate aldolase